MSTYGYVGDVKYFLVGHEDYELILKIAGSFYGLKMNTNGIKNSCPVEAPPTPFSLLEIQSIAENPLIPEPSKLAITYIRNVNHTCCNFDKFPNGKIKENFDMEFRLFGITKGVSVLL
jgi:hypothetical protein